MITELNSSYYIGSNYLKAAELCGMSTDVKPINVGNGSTLYEIDTGKKYMFDAAGKEWYEQAEGGGGSGMFVVEVIIDDDMETILSADHTVSEVLEAYSSGASIEAKILGGGQALHIPLTVATDDGFSVVFMALIVGQTSPEADPPFIELKNYKLIGVDAPGYEAWEFHYSRYNVDVTIPS